MGRGRGHVLVYSIMGIIAYYINFPALSVDLLLFCVVLQLGVKDPTIFILFVQLYIIIYIVII